MTTFRRLIAAVVSVMILATTAPMTIFADTDPTITVSKVEASAGDTVDVAINISNNPGIISMLLDVTYDSNLTLTAVKNGTVLNGATHNTNALTANPYTLSWGDDTATENNTNNGTIVTFSFKVAEDATGELPITVTYNNDDYAIYDMDFNLVDFAVVNGSVTVKVPHTHSYGAWTKVDETNHKRVCACGEEELEAHTWDEGVVTTPATHTKEGVKTYTCTVCGGTKTEPIAKLTEHNYGAWTKVDDNNHKRVCECGDEVIAPHWGAGWLVGVVTTPATHTTEGVMTYTCDMCGATKTEPIAKLTEHNYGAWTKVDETNHKRVCACGEEETEAHAWNEGVVTTPATHTAEGVKTYTCTVCGATTTKPIAKLTGHTFGAWTKVDGNSHKRTCECGEEETEAHAWDEGVVTTEPTTTSEGVKTYTCTVCGATKTEAIEKLPSVHTHTFGEWTKVDGNSHKRVCACGEEETEAHAWDEGVVTTEPTTTSEGVKTYTCTVCGATKTEPIEKLVDPVPTEPTIAVSKIIALAGDTVDVEVAIINNPGIISMLLEVAYDSNLTLTAVKNGTVLNGATHNTNALTANPYTLSWGDDTASENNTKNGTIVTFSFKVAENATGELPITVTYNNDNYAIYDMDFDLVDFAVVNGSVIVEAPHTHSYGAWTKVDETNHKRVCECGEEETEAHTWDEGVVTTEPTTTSEGVKTYTCTVCGATKTEPIEKLPSVHTHTFGDWTSVDENNHKRVCACGEEDIEAHTWNDGVVTTPATHMAEGVKTYTCTVCGAIKTEPIAKLTGHTFGEWTKVDDTNHKRTCECGEEETEAHTWDEGVVTTEPTTTSEGVKTYTCTVCGATKTETIEKLPSVHTHSFGDWTKVDDTNHKRVCACGEEETEAHAWDEGVVTTEPTTTSEGVKTYTCTVCGATKTEAIPKIILYGDINGDGKVNRSDLVRLTKYFAGYDVQIDETASDVTGDGKVNRSDLVRLTKYFAGYDVELGKK